MSQNVARPGGASAHLGLTLTPVTPLNRAAGSTIVDCQSCVVRPIACHDCVVSFLLGGPPEEESQPDLDATEVAALAVLADSGLVPPLRLVRGTPS